MQLLLGFAAVAVLLSTLGIYGLLSYRIREERREIGVRLALGATPTTVLRWIAVEVGRVLVFGGIVGLVVAVSVARTVAVILFGVPPWDPVTGAAVVTLLMAIGVLAAMVPAYRAATLEPATVLRSE
jgi:ABC-type antimicrobial peptide transport system permease subunit